MIYRQQTASSNIGIKALQTVCLLPPCASLRLRTLPTPLPMQVVREFELESGLVALLEQPHQCPQPVLRIGRRLCFVCLALLQPLQV
jgi:hypothetical protein